MVASLCERHSTELHQNGKPKQFGVTYFIITLYLFCMELSVKKWSSGKEKRSKKGSCLLLSWPRPLEFWARPKDFFGMEETPLLLFLSSSTTFLPLTGLNYIYQICIYYHLRVYVFQLLKVSFIVIIFCDVIFRFVESKMEGIKKVQGNRGQLLTLVSVTLWANSSKISQSCIMLACMFSKCVCVCYFWHCSLYFFLEKAVDQY